CAHHRDLHSFPTRRSSDLYRTNEPLSVDEDHRATRLGGYKVESISTGVITSRKVAEIVGRRKLNQAFGDKQSFTLPVLRGGHLRSEEHTSELQSRENLVCR